MIGLQVSSNVDSVVAKARNLTAGLRDRAMVRALNRAQDASGTAAGREIRSVYNLKARVVNAAMKKSRATAVRPTATTRIASFKIGLANFDARWKQGQPGGVTAKVLVSGGRETYPGTFIVRSARGRPVVVRRVGKSRYPISSVKVISIPEAFVETRVIEEARKVADETFRKTLAQQVEYLSAARPIGFAYG